MVLSGTKLHEIRVPIDNSSIAGYVANTKKAVNISDAYDEKELKTIDPELRFDSSWDRRSGFRTKQVLAVPIIYEQNLMGVIQIINRKGGGSFSDEDRSFLEEIAGVLGIALYNQRRVARRRKTRFDLLLNRGLLSEQELENSWQEARKSGESMEEFLMKKYRISKEDLGQSLEDFYRAKFVEFDEKQPTPEGLLTNLRQEYLRRELWVPLEKVDGKVRVLVDDPDNILKRDTIESLLKTKTIEYCVGLKDDILKYINHFYRPSGSAEESIAEMLGRLELTEEKKKKRRKSRYPRRTASSCSWSIKSSTTQTPRGRRTYTSNRMCKKRRWESGSGSTEIASST